LQPGFSGPEFSVNGDQRIKTAGLAVIIAHESVLGPDFNVAVIPVPINEDRTDRCCIWITDRQSLESVTAHELVAGFGCVGGFWIGTNHAGGDQRVFHVMPAVRLRVRMGALLRECCRPRQFWVEARIDFRKRMNDRFFPVMMDDPNGCHLTRSVLVNKLFGRFLETLISKR
jgi:hypothetical protein